MCHSPAFTFSSVYSLGFGFWVLGFGFLAGLRLGALRQFKPFWPLALVQQAPQAIIFQALHRLRGAVLFRSLRTSSSSGFPFWLLCLTLRSSGPAFCGPLTLPVSLHVIIQAMLYLSPLPPSCSSVGSGAFLGVCGFLVFFASSARSACASSFCFCSAVCLRSIFGLAAVANRSVKPTRLRRAAYFLSLAA